MAFVTHYLQVRIIDYIIHEKRKVLARIRAHIITTHPESLENVNTVSDIQRF